MAALPLDLSAVTLDSLRAASREHAPREVLSTGIAAVDRILPDGGLPHGSVIELCSPAGLARSTHLALSLCASAQRLGSSTLQTESEVSQSGWCAWIDASRTLFAPGVARAGIDLGRLLVVRPDPEDLARVAVRVVSSRVFSVVVVDRCGIPGAEVSSRARWNVAVRRLALAAEDMATVVLILSSHAQARAETLPTAMRIEIDRPEIDQLTLQITKERRGRLSSPITLGLIDLVAPSEHRRAG